MRHLPRAAALSLACLKAYDLDYRLSEDRPGSSESTQAHDLTDPVTEQVIRSCAKSVGEGVVLPSLSFPVSVMDDQALMLWDSRCVAKPGPGQDHLGGNSCYHYKDSY